MGLYRHVNRQIGSDGEQYGRLYGKAKTALKAETKRNPTEQKEPEKNTQPTLFLHFGF